MPSRFVRNCPGCAISAGTDRSVILPIESRSSVTGAARRAAIGGVDLNRIVEDFERQARRLGRFLGEHDRTRAGIEHHRDARAVDLGRDRETAAAAARNFDRAPPGRCATRHELGEHPVGDIAQLETIGVSQQKEQRDGRPDEHRFEDVGKTLAKQRERDEPDEDQRRDLGFERRVLEMGEFVERHLILPQHEDEHGNRQRSEQDPEEAAHG